MAFEEQTFVNTGFEAVSKRNTSVEHQTIIILGVPRSGTSMVALILKEMGIFIGDAIDGTVFEDRDIAKAITSGNKNIIKNIIENRNNNHNNWGFKRPDAYRYLKDKVHLFRNPLIVSTFRDPVAIAKRNQVSMYTDFSPALDAAVEETKLLSKFLNAQECPLLYVSYEKALLDPRAFVVALAKFIDMELTNSELNRISKGVQNGPKAYRQASRLHFDGVLEYLGADKVSGWIYQVGNPKPVRINVLLNENIIATGAANVFRQDLKNANKNKGVCSFSIPISVDKNKLSEITVVVENTKYTIPKVKKIAANGIEFI